ncbi:MAG: YbaB/EbfC family nucleoid-associated protein [Pseudomonadota bacterium]
MKNFKNIMKQAQEMQEKMIAAQEKLADLVVDGKAGGGMVTATVNGKGELQKLKLDPSIVDADDVEMLEDLIIAAVSDAKSKAESMAADEMSKVTGGMALPDNLPF